MRLENLGDCVIWKIVFKWAWYICLQALQCSVQLHRLLVESPLIPSFHIYSTTCFSHTRPSSGIYDDLHKLLYCIVILYRWQDLFVWKFIILKNFHTFCVYRRLWRIELKGLMIIFSYKTMLLVEHNYMCHPHELSLKMQLMKIYTLGQDTSLEHQMISEWNSDNLFLPPLPYMYNKHSHGNLQRYQLQAATVLVSHLRLLGN